MDSFKSSSKSSKSSRAKFNPKKYYNKRELSVGMITVVYDTHGHPGDDERESGTPELWTPKTVLKPSIGQLSVQGLGVRNHLLQLNKLSPVISGSLLHGRQEILSLPIEDVPVGRLREEEDDQHAGAAEDRDAHQEVFILGKDDCNQGSWNG